MSKAKKSTGPIPEGNQSPFGPKKKNGEQPEPAAPRGAPASEKDPKGRLGNYGMAGEHPIDQPGGKQGAHGKGRKD